MDCCGCGCFGFLRKLHQCLISFRGSGTRFSRELLLPDNMEGADGTFYNGDSTNPSDGGSYRSVKCSEEILLSRARNGLICREVPVKETRNVILSEVFHKSHLLKMRVAPSETAMTDVLREVSIMKMLDHPNIVNLIEVIDDPNTDHFYMVLEYVEGKWVCEGTGLGESTSRRYLRDIVAGLMYLHAHNIVHGDIKPDNLLVTSNGKVKIGDFSVSQVFEDDNDVLRRSPGTPVFTAPECCLGLTYHGKAADTWAVGVTLYCMVLGQYPFLGDTLQDTYDKIVNNPLFMPDDINPELKNLLEGLLCKDPKHRITLHALAEHPWVIGEEGPIPEYLCRCRRISSARKNQ
nr:serine/threonine-protein kinase GRIK2 isoform X4 [Elaeis guineensis]